MAQLKSRVSWPDRIGWILEGMLTTALLILAGLTIGRCLLLIQEAMAQSR